MLSKKDLTSIQKDLSQYDRARERVLDLSRAATRMASSSILEIHRGDLKSANLTLEQAANTLQSFQRSESKWTRPEESLRPRGAMWSRKSDDSHSNRP